MTKKVNQKKRKSSSIPEKAIKGLSKRKKEIPRVVKLSDKKWEFSFQSWAQRDFFGLKHEKVSKQWFVDLLDRLRDLSSKNIEDVTLDSAARGSYRFHKINWGEKSSIKKEKFYEYIPEEYRTEETDIIQFQIEQSKGRVIGFFDYNQTFQVILLDPAHNMQLSKYNNYKTVKTDFLRNSYEEITTKFLAITDKFDRLEQSQESEKIGNFIDEIRSVLNKEGFSSDCKFVKIEKFFFDEINEILLSDSEYNNLDDIILEALDMLKEKKNQETLNNQ